MLPESQEASEGLLNNGLGYASWLREQGDAERIAEARSSSMSALAAVRPTMEEVAQFRDTILGLRGISSPLTAASKRAARNIDRVIKIGETMEAFAERTLLLLEDLPEGPHEEAAESDGP